MLRVHVGFQARAVVVSKCEGYIEQHLEAGSDYVARTCDHSSARIYDALLVRLQTSRRKT
jgi:hypothetical protein